MKPVCVNCGWEFSRHRLVSNGMLSGKCPVWHQEIRCQTCDVFSGNRHLAECTSTLHISTWSPSTEPARMCKLCNYPFSAHDQEFCPNTVHGGCPDCRSPAGLWHFVHCTKRVSEYWGKYIQGPAVGTGLLQAQIAGAQLTRCKICQVVARGQNSSPNLTGWMRFVYPVLPPSTAARSEDESSHLCPPCAVRVANYIAHLSAPMLDEEDLL